MPKVVGNNVIISVVDRRRKGSCPFVLSWCPVLCVGLFMTGKKKKEKWLAATVVSSSWAGCSIPPHHTLLDLLPAGILDPLFPYFIPSSSPFLTTAFQQANSSSLPALLNNSLCRRPLNQPSSIDLPFHW